MPSAASSIIGVPAVLSRSKEMRCMFSFSFRSQFEACV